MKPAFLILTSLFLMVACHRAVPADEQASEPDSAAIAEIEQKYYRALRSDDEVVQTLIESGELEHWGLHEYQYWFRYVHHSDLDPVTVGTCHQISIQYRDTCGHLLLDEKRVMDIRDILALDYHSYTDLPYIVELAMKEMALGDTVIIAAPWYTAFSDTGCTAVPPYTNVFIRLSIDSIRLEETEYEEDY